MCLKFLWSNGNSDQILYVLAGDKRTALDWNSRLKIAIGAARGLRYLHEDCRVGCIVHRDLRPKNILLTHDFEPMVIFLAVQHLEPKLHQFYFLFSSFAFDLAFWK